jgi:WD40 repeat protein
VAFSPDGSTLATAVSDGTVQLWDVAGRRRRGPPLPVSPLAVYGVAFSPDGSTLATAAEDRLVRLWDVRSRRALGAPLDRHIEAVNDVEFSPDGSLLASASKDDRIRLWSSLLWSSANPRGDSALERAICARIWRRLSRAEWRTFLPGERYRDTCPDA